MKNFLPLLLCLSLSFFTLARATKPNHTTAVAANTTLKGGELAAKQKAEFEPINPQQKKGTDEEVASANDDSMEDASDDEGEAANDDDDGGDAAGDKNSGDDNSGDDDGGENGGDDGGGDEGE